MGKVILAINTGSSSVKVSVYSYNSSSEEETPKELAAIQVSGLTAPPSTLKYDRGESTPIKDKELPDVQGQEAAFSYILSHLTSDADLPELSSANDIEFACHRIVHGGDYDRPTLINKSTLHHLEELSDLAPLHNGPALKIVRAVHEACPAATNLAFFDSAYHSTLPASVKTYAIDPKTAKSNKLRKYGFHGLSYSFISRAVATHLSKPLTSTNLIALHLGSGASAACIRGGASLDTSMGLTPLSGLPGATRSGDVDASLIFHFTHDAGKPSASSTKELSITTAEEILNKKSGWSAMTGTTDFGAICEKAQQQQQQGGEECKLAVEVFVDRLVGFIGSYFVKLGGEVDGLVFAGGIGEKGSWLRKVVVEKVACLGFEIDEERNGKLDEEGGDVVEIGKASAKRKVLVCRTDEQVEMAMQCVKEAGRLKAGSE